MVRINPLNSNAENICIQLVIYLLQTGETVEPKEGWFVL